MKSAIEWFKEKGFLFDDKITIKDVIDLQNDARKDAFMTAQGIASDVINSESHYYSVIDDPKPGPPAAMSLSGLNYKVCSAITAKGDELEYLPIAKSRSI